MEVEDEVIEADGFEPSLDDIERGPFFAHEEHGFALRDQRRDQVADRLRFPGSGRPFDGRM